MVWHMSRLCVVCGWVAWAYCLSASVHPSFISSRGGVPEEPPRGGLSQPRRYGVSSLLFLDFSLVPRCNNEARRPPGKGRGEHRATAWAFQPPLLQAGDLPILALGRLGERGRKEMDQLIIYLRSIFMIMRHNPSHPQHI